MTYKNITHDLEAVSEEQVVILEIAEKLLENINSIKPFNYETTKSSFNGEEFKVVRTGFMHAFLLEDIEVVIKNNKEKHFKFMLEKVQDYFKSFDYYSDKSKNSFNVLKDSIKYLLMYYKLNSKLEYPTYFQSEDYKDYIKNIELKCDEQFLKY